MNDSTKDRDCGCVEPREFQAGVLESHGFTDGRHLGFRFKDMRFTNGQGAIHCTGFKLLVQGGVIIRKSIDHIVINANINDIMGKSGTFFPSGMAELNDLQNFSIDFSRVQVDGGLKLQATFTGRLDFGGLWGSRDFKEAHIFNYGVEDSHFTDGCFYIQGDCNWPTCRTRACGGPCGGPYGCGNWSDHGTCVTGICP